MRVGWVFSEWEICGVCNLYIWIWGFSGVKAVLAEPRENIVKDVLWG